LNSSINGGLLYDDQNIGDDAWPKSPHSPGPERVSPSIASTKTPRFPDSAHESPSINTTVSPRVSDLERVSPGIASTESPRVSDSGLASPIHASTESPRVSDLERVSPGIASTESPRVSDSGLANVSPCFTGSKLVTPIIASTVTPCSTNSFLPFSISRKSIISPRDALTSPYEVFGYRQEIVDFGRSISSDLDGYRKRVSALFIQNLSSEAEALRKMNISMQSPSGSASFIHHAVQLSKQSSTHTERHRLCKFIIGWFYSGMFWTKLLFF
jgi:hypothetical protein